MKNQYLKYGLFENKYLIAAFILGAILQVGVLFIPSLANIFKLTELNKIQWIYTIAIAISPLLIMEIQKKFNELKFGKTVYLKGSSPKTDKLSDLGTDIKKMILKQKITNKEIKM